jgi:anti-sigma factor RsiW
MDCTQIAELAPLYLSGELDRERAGAVDAHLKSCPACMQDLESQAGLDARIREAMAAERVDSTGVERWIRAHIAAEPRGKVASAPSRRAWMTAAMGIAALLLLIAAGYRGLLSQHVARVYADAAQDHQLEVIQQEPRPWLSDRSAISALTEKQGIAGSVPFALSSGAYRLERAKLCYLDGRVFLHAVYTDGAQEFSVYFRVRGAESLPGRARESDNGRPLHVSALNGEQVASFQTDNLTVMVVSDRSSDVALQVARFAATAL